MPAIQSPAAEEVSPDIALVERAKQGDTEAFEQLVRQYERQIFRVAQHITQNREDAEDITQDVFLKAYEKLDQFQGNSKFSTWLYSIARNHCFNEIKSRGAKPEDAGEPLLAALADTSPDAHTKLERQDAAQMLRELVRDSLSDIEARVITLHYAEELPLTAVTRLLNLDNTSGAKAYIVSARRKLARAVARWKPVTQR